MKEWFVLHTKPYSERKVALRLERYEIQTYVPQTSSQSERADARPVPFFPGYLFIRLDLDRTNPKYWRTTPGVRYIISYGDIPIAVDETLIHTIEQQIDALEGRQQRRGRFTRGDRVRIMNGPLQDMIAIFDGPTEPAERVQVLLKVMSRYKRIRVAASDLEKVTEDNETPNKKRRRRSRGRGRPIRS